LPLKTKIFYMTISYLNTRVQWSLRPVLIRSTNRKSVLKNGVYIKQVPFSVTLRNLECVHLVWGLSWKYDYCCKV